MQDEIFGPILCVIPVNNMDEGIDYVQKHSRPLALYIFAEDKDVTNNIIHSTSSGGVGVNHCLYIYYFYINFNIDSIYLILICHLVVLDIVEWGDI